MPSEVTYLKAEHVATITMTTHDGQNVLSAELRDDLRAALAEAQGDPDVRAVVLTAEGENFCVDAPLAEGGTSGADGDGPGTTESDLFGLRGVEVTDALVDFDKPVVAGINGIAAGCGCDIALCCDIRVAGDTARIGPNQIRRGLVAGASIYFLPRVVRFGRACELIFTGDLLDAREAENIGLFDHVVPDAQLPETAQGLAIAIAKGPPIAMRLTKRAIYRGLALNSDAAKEYTVLSRSLGMHVTQESREGFNSFNERRAPNF
jgi:2-(1,2-epoxy-1,2-dihydrophenyl)acetyl-CoA isomerase